MLVGDTGNGGFQERIEMNTEALQIDSALADLAIASDLAHELRSSTNQQARDKAEEILVELRAAARKLLPFATAPETKALEARFFNGRSS
jgi:hypothetical protein